MNKILSSPPAAQQGEIFVMRRWRSNTHKASNNSGASGNGEYCKRVYNFNSFNEHFTARELFKIVHLRFQDPPPAFHWSIIKTSSDTRHTLNHTHINNFLVKYLVCVLETSVAVEYGFRIGISS